MSEQSYRLTVIACAASWLMVGLHAPVVHQLTHHHNPDWAMLAALACLVAAGVATTVALFRSAAGRGQPPLRPDARG